MKKLLLIIVVLAVVIAGIWLLSSSSKEQQVLAPAEDSTGMIANDLNNINLGDLNSDFQSVNADVNSL